MCKLNSRIFVQVAGQKGHRRRYGKQRRVTLGGMTVDEATKRQRKIWEKVTHSAGILEDQLIAFAQKHGFKPRKHLPSGGGMVAAQGYATTEDHAGRNPLKP